MTALAADRDTKLQGIAEDKLPLAASTKIYAGSLVMTDSSQNAKPGADTASCCFAGVANEQADNASGAAADKYVTVKRTGKFKFAFSGTALATSNNVDVYLVDDQTVAYAATTTNDVKCGRQAKYVSASEIWVQIDSAF